MTVLFKCHCVFFMTTYDQFCVGDDSGEHPGMGSISNTCISNTKYYLVFNTFERKSNVFFYLNTFHFCIFKIHKILFANQPLY